MNHESTHLDLFSGIGGFALAAQWAGFRTVAFCEIDAYCQAILKERFGAVMADSDKRRQQEFQKRDGKSKEHSTDRDSCGRNIGGCGGPRLFGDIRTLDASRYAGVDLLTGGFPCQPFSCAGKRGGSSDDRFLWPEMLRVVSEARPAWVLGENVAGIVTMELDRVLSDLENIGYAVWPLVIPAVAVDARHRRDRVWIVANDDRCKREASWTCETQGWPADLPFNGSFQVLSDSTIERCEDGGGMFSGLHQSPPGEREGESVGDSCGRKHAEWDVEPNVGRVAHGVPKRVDRLKGLGNAIVPQVAFQILQTIKALI